MKIKWHKSLIFKLALILFFTQFVLSSIIGYYFIKTIRRELTNKAYNTTLSGLNTVIEYISSNFNSYIKNLNLLASMPAIYNFDRDEIIEILKSYSISSLFIAGEVVYVIDNNGNIIADNTMLLSVDREKNFKYLNSLVDPLIPYISDVKWDKNFPYINVAVAIQNPARANGVLLAEFSMRRFSDYISSYKVGQDGFAFLVDNKGNIIAHPDKRYVANRLNIKELGLEIDQPLDKFKINSIKFFKLSNNKTYLVLYSYLKDYHIGVFALQPKASIEKIIAKVNLTILMIILSIFLVIVLVSFYISYRIFKPIGILVNKMIDFNPNERLKIEFPYPVEEREDEIGIMARVFEDMSNKIYETMTELKEKLEYLRKINEGLFNLINIREKHNLLNKYLDMILKLFEIDYVSISLLNEKGEKEEYLENYNEDVLKDKDKNSIKEIIDYINKKVIIQNQTEVVNKDFSLISIPIKVGDKFIGVLNCYKFSKSFFNEDKVEVLEIFSKQIGVGLENLRLLSEEKVKMKIEEEIKNAEIIQSELFPSKFYENNKLEIYSSYMPAGRLNGDWFYYFWDEYNEEFYYFIGDVTGHGISAALLTGAVHSFIKMIEKEYKAVPNKRYPITDIMKDLNYLLLETTKDLNMTFIISRFNFKEGNVEICNAGHNNPILFRKQEDELQYLTLYNQNYRLGEDISQGFVSEKFEIRKDDIILFYTDGLIEWQTKKGTEWGRKGIVRFILKNYNEDVVSLVDAIEKYIKTEKAEDLKDDYTISLLKIKNER